MTMGVKSGDVRIRMPKIIIIVLRMRMMNNYKDSMQEDHQDHQD